MRHRRTIVGAATRSTFLAALLAAALLLSACGGDDALSTGDYRAQAKKICQDAKRASDAVDQPTRATNAAIVDYFKQLLATNEQSTKRFADLDPPDELKDAHEATLKANREGADEVRHVISELEKGGDAQEVLTDAQTRLQSLQARSQEASKQLGVPECSG